MRRHKGGRRKVRYSRVTGVQAGEKELGEKRAKSK